MTMPYLGAHALPSITKQGCEEMCGNVFIRYPFGIGSNCSIHDGFAITCNHTLIPPKPFLKNTNLEVLEIDIYASLVYINNPIISSGCPSIVDSGPKPTDLSEIPLSPFTYTASFLNSFVSTSCNHYAKLSIDGNVVTGCGSICNASSTSGKCDGINCCQITLPYALKYINASMEKIYEYDDENNNTSCKMIFVAAEYWVEDNWVNNTMGNNITHVPAVLNWQNYEGNKTLFKNSNGVSCPVGNTSGACFCIDGYNGNPYTGCEDIDECGDRSLNECAHYCRNYQGGYECYCKAGYIKDGNKCTKNETLKFAILGTCIGLGVLFLLIGCWWLRKLVRRRKQVKQKKKFFRRNGGLLLQQQISSDKGNFKATKFFTSKELEKATENYNVNRVLGQGGQGTVYKGMLTDGRLVAVKKAKILDEGQLDVFINEVVILSQINHRNIVKLLGCCLETEVPMLVYEYIPNGTLYQYVHNQIEEFPLSWELRLRIAREVAGALSYLHSAASVPIYHRDIKSTNILLDEKYRAKIADFGTSRLISVDQTHLTTAVKGTFAYLDPVYFRSNKFTEKSDVYSFGVVLVELLTGQKAVPLNLDEWRGLVGYFLLKMEENRLFDIIDPRVAKEGQKKEILVVANLALSCLNLNRKQRPTMMDVLVELKINLPKIESGSAL